jgi:predicted ATP-grasp superfamily ATP-dependent carboligase
LRYQRFLDRATVVPPVVVLGVFSGPNEIGIVRDLGRRGVPGLVLDNNPAGLHVPSRYAAKRPVPDPHHDDEGFLDELERIARDLPQKAVLFPGRDDYLLPVVGAADRLAPYFLMPFAGPAVMSRLLDKWQQFEAAQRAGVDTPRSALLLTAEDVADTPDDFPFPAILKPTTGQAAQRNLGIKLVPVDRASDLPEAYERACVCGPLLLQERIPGDDDATYYLGSYLDGSSEPLAVFTGRRLRQYPRGSGAARSAESVWVPEVADAGLRLLRELRFHGVSHVEFKRDPRDGRYKLIEINARHYGTHALASASGVDLSGIAYDDALGRRVTAPRQREGVRWITARRDVPASAQEMLHGDLSPKDWLTSLRGTRVDGVFSFDDPLPGLADGVRVSVRLARRGVRIAVQKAGIGAA